MSTDTNYIFYCMDKDIYYFHNTNNINTIDMSPSYHRHDGYEIYLFLQGNTNVYIERACYHMVPGDLIITRPDEMHRSVCLNSNELYERIVINLKKPFLQHLSSQLTDLSACFEAHPLGINNLVHLTDSQLTHYVTLANKLDISLTSKEYGQDILVKSYLSQLLVFINSLYKTSAYISKNIMPELVHNTMLYIENHLTEPISLTQLSQNFSYSGTYISNKFKHHTGLTLRSYILDQRILLAKRLLTQGKNVSEACYLSGFKDYANFIRSFTNSVGISPGKFKQQY